ncbi:hypothetical protein FJZ31_35785 [Candidatus Poribacteria bacterium]|nr:hypothetical protein [Candidatus Poribacteria bacterium]
MKKFNKTQTMKRFREMILAEYPYLKYAGTWKAEGITHLIFTMTNGDELELEEEIVSRLNKVILETGHFFLAGVDAESEVTKLPGFKRNSF